MHNNVDHHQSNNCKCHQFQMICPTVRIHMNLFLNHFFLHQSLTASNCCLVSSWCSLYLLALYHWWCNVLWFHWCLTFLNLCVASWILHFLCWSFDLLFWFFFNHLLSFLFFGWGFFSNSRYALRNRFLNCWLLNWLRCLFLRSGCFLLLDWCSWFRYWRFYFFSCWRPSFLDWRLSFSHWGFEGSFIFEAFNDFFKSESGLFKINFKFDGILVRDFDFFLKSVLWLFLEASNVSSGININTSKIILLIGLLFIKLKGERGFAIGIEVGYIKVELAPSERHDIGTVRINKVRVSHDFVFVEFLHAYIPYKDYLCKWRTWTWIRVRGLVAEAGSDSQGTAGNSKILGQ